MTKYFTIITHIVNQKTQLRNAHDTIKRQRDLHAAAEH